MIWNKTSIKSVMIINWTALKSHLEANPKTTKKWNSKKFTTPETYMLRNKLDNAKTKCWKTLKVDQIVLCQIIANLLVVKRIIKFRQFLRFKVGAFKFNKKQMMVINCCKVGWNFWEKIILEINKRFSSRGLKVQVLIFYKKIKPN